MAKKILVSLLGNYSDVILGTTVVHALKERDKERIIDCVVHPQMMNILEGNPDIATIVPKEDYYEANLYYAENSYDEFIRIGFTNVFNASWHRIDGNNKHLADVLASRAGIENLEDKNTYIYLNENDIADINDYWEDLDKDAKYFAIHTNASVANDAYTARDWDINNYERVAQYLISKGFKVIQVGLSTDRKLKTEGVIDFTSKFTFKQNMEVIKRCAGFIGPDSGMAYLAGASGTKSLILMGSTQFTGKDSGPSTGSRQDSVFYFNAPKPNHPACSPSCFAEKCVIGKAIGCTEQISAEMAINGIESIMQKKD